MLLHVSNPAKQTFGEKNTDLGETLTPAPNQIAFRRFLDVFGPWENGMTWCREVLFPTNPALADIMGDMDSNFGNFHLSDFLDC